MKFKHVALFVCGLALAAAQTGGKQEPSLQKAIQTEMVDGDLKAAIKQYGDIVAQYGKSDRGVAAAALLRMAECYAKLSDAEARKIFERVVHEYADQKDAVELARLRLDTPVRPPTLINRRIWASSEISHPSRPSADGRYMSYIGENGNLTIYNFGTGESRLLTNKKSWSESHSQATYSIPSHDGKHIAYVWYDADSSKEGLYEIRIASLGNSDGQHRVVFRTNSEIPRVVLDDWSSDGRNLLAI